MIRRNKWLIYLFVAGIFFLVITSGQAAPRATPTIYLPLVFRNFDPNGPGGVRGVITNAENGLPIAGAQVCYLSTCVISLANGTFSLYPIQDGLREIQVTAATYSPAAQTVQVPKASFVVLDFALTPLGTGTLSGVITNKFTNEAIFGASICRLTNCTTTDEDGNYVLSNIQHGLREFVITATDYEGITPTLDIAPDGITEGNFGLVPILTADFRILVTWSTNTHWPPNNEENDLDAHLWMETGGIPFHIFFDCPSVVPGLPGFDNGDCYYFNGDLSSYPYAALQLDQRRGTGPEIIDITLQPGVTYHYAVDSINHANGYEGVPPVNDPSVQAVVTVQSLSGNVINLTPPASPTGSIWYVMTIDSLGNITPTNCIPPRDPHFMDYGQPNTYNNPDYFPIACPP
jgi:hypothetical protein